MKQFFKALCAVSTALSVAIFSAVAYGTSALPDKIILTEGETLDLGTIYSSDDEPALAAGTGDSAEYKTVINALKVIPVKNITINISKRRYVGIGGDIFGIKLYTKGVIVVSVDSVSTANGEKNPALEAGIKCGDIITHINGEPALNTVQMTKSVENSQGKALKLSIDRNGEKFELTLKPELSVNGNYKAGIWVRDSSAGIGTITFYDDDAMVFGGLGHGVCDVDTGKIMPLNNGEAVRAKVNGFYKSSAGNPGELCGVFSDIALGSLRVNCETGVYGELLQPSGAKTLPVALEGEVKLGAAKILTTIDENGPQYYDIEITRIYPSSDMSTRNMIIKVTDPELLEKTGGIVQGMSGSPIVQNSMLVGAVTHVFVNDPTQGYGIFANRMIQTRDSLENAA